MKLDSTKGVIDDHEDNFAIVFAAMGVSVVYYTLYMLIIIWQGFIQWGRGRGKLPPQILQLPSQNFKLPPCDCTVVVIVLIIASPANKNA